MRPDGHIFVFEKYPSNQKFSNSNRLKVLAENLGVKSYLIDFANEIDEVWLKDASTVGVTAGASAPEVLVEGVINKLKIYGFNYVYGY